MDTPNTKKKIKKYGLIIIKEKKFLINRKYNTKLFLMPGGKPEKEESVEDCLIREIREEHQCEIIKSSLNYFGTFEDKAANESDTIIEMHLYKAEIKGEPKINQEIEEQKWFGKNDNPEILSPIIKNKILPEIIKRKII